MLKKKKYIWLPLAVGAIVVVLISTGGCKKNSEVIQSIVLDFAQSAWDLSHTNGSESVAVSLVGQDVDKIVLDSIEMKGDNPAAGTLKAGSAAFQGDRVKAEFSKSGVLELLNNPSSGSTHRITVQFDMTDREQRMEVGATITVNSTETLTLEIDPVEWSLNYDRSSGTVEAFIRGEGIENIDLSSIEIMGDNLSAAPLPASSAVLQGDHIHARFPKNRVLDLLLNPTGGSTHTITVSFLETGGTEPQELSTVISIEEDDDEIVPSELELEIDPSEWSLNFDNSSGTVEAFIRGKGIENIDLSTIEMIGDNPSAVPLPASSAVLQGDHIHAGFPKNRVLDLLLNPTGGSTHTITVSFLVFGGSERIELTAVITIEEDDDEEKPSELSLELSPDVWNLNYTGSSGTVTAFIRGEGYEDIDLDSIEMTGDNSSAEALAADSASRQGNHVRALFAKNQVLDLLLNPASGTTHTVTVSFFEIGGGQRQELSAQVTITGKSK